ncbi:alpha/beta hydrolase [Flavobacterium sp.]|uniref:alpha/beta fold hydrolase n=1 Tax=Flavobacterium sp. TaxID=239 RepID=UPI00286CEE62|nr:alpha/beta hydrolase [Flavobacterium sp.]
MNTEISDWKNRGNYFEYNNLKTFYIHEGQGEVILILHGYPFSSFEWVAVFNELVKTNSVVILDLLGMGFSDKPQNHKYSFEEYCDIINVLLLKLKINNILILAHDLGASVAQELLARNKKHENNFKINSIAFMNGGIFLDVYKPRLIQKLLSQTPNFIGKFLSKKISKNAIFKSVKATYGTNTQPSESFVNQQWEILNLNEGKSITYLIGRLVFDKINYQSRWITAMQTTTIPICYICGVFDPNSGIHMANRYKELIPKPKVYLLGETIGHWPHLEDGDNVISIFRDFIKNESRI